MIATVITALWLLFVFVLLGMLAYQAHNGNSQLFLFQDFQKVLTPYITIDIQGHLFNMIVDSGSVVSIISKDALSQIEYEPCMRQVDLNAITNESVPANMVTIPFILDNRELKEDFVVHDVEDFANFGKLYGVTIHGLFGNEFLENTGCKIDYRKHLITLY